MSLAADARRSELAVYVGRIREFDRTDWLVYAAWIGTMLGLVMSTGGFLVLGWSGGVPVSYTHLTLPTTERV